MEFQYTPKSELEVRIKNLQGELLANNIDAAVIVQKADLFYFSGTSQNAHLIVPAQGKPILKVKRSLRRAENESALEYIEQLTSLKELKTLLTDYKTIGFELDVLPVTMYFKYKKMLSFAEIVDVSEIIRKIRMIKSDYEIDQLKAGAKLNILMFSAAAGIIKEGMYEIEVASELEALYRKNGHQGGIRVRGFNSELFYGHLMSGANAAYPSFFDGPTGGSGVNPSYPQSAGFKKIGRNEPILVDYAGVYNGYIVDQTRIFVIGQLPDTLTKAYQTSLNIKKEIIKQAIPGSNGKRLFDLAETMAVESGFGDYFMGYKDKVRFVAHGIGIELDEYPVVAKNFDFELQEGMVIALEPKFIFPDQGVAGIEDTLVVRKTGLEQITYFDEAIQGIDG